MKDWTWSFSRVNLYDTCPYAAYKRYIEEDPGIDNCYSQAGSLMHKCLEEITRQQMTVQDALDWFIEVFDDTCDMPIPEKIRDNTFDKMVAFLADLDDHALDGYEVLGVEKEVFFNVNGIRFKGYIDLLLRDQNGDIIIVDHKSSGYPLGKNGQVLKSKEKEFLDHRRQLCLYARAVMSEYNRWPKALVWNHFKDGKVCTIPFDWVEAAEAVGWAEEVIERMMSDEEFAASKNYFYCYNLCGYRDGTCEYLFDDAEE